MQSSDTGVRGTRLGGGTWTLMALHTGTMKVLETDGGIRTQTLVAAPLGMGVCMSTDKWYLWHMAEAVEWKQAGLYYGDGNGYGYGYGYGSGYGRGYGYGGYGGNGRGYKY